MTFSASAQDADGSADHPLIGRYEGSSIHAYQYEDFDEVRLKKEPGGPGSHFYEGVLTRIHYKLPRSVSVAAALKWSGKTGQSVKVYPPAKNGYRNDQETQIFR
jgi:hypothetical protein